MAAPTPEDAHVVPVLQAGGGTAQALASSHTVMSFMPAVKSYLDKIHASLSTDSSGPASFLTNTQKDTTDKAFTDRNGFLEYMSSPASSAMSAPKKHDLSRPISNYFISTSHNTYLSGNQLYGEASTAAYTNVLVRGCRCLEIDVWDGESKVNSNSEEDTADSKGSHWQRLKARARSPHRHEDTQSQTTQAPGAERLPDPWRSPSKERRVEPRVLHGHTLTKEVSFRAVCNAIKDSAFVATELPVIVSLEVHAGLDQQEVMVEIMKETWKGMLVDIMAKQEEDIEHLPSPDELRRKILIKVKWTPNSKTGESNDPHDQVASNSSEDEDLSQASSHASSTSPQKKKASKILQSLSQLGIYTRAYSFKRFEQAEATIPTHVFSLSEKKVLDVHETHGSELFNHNRNYMMRVFPSGLRVNSSNVEPTFLWQQGAQMVALNWQKWDAGMMLNEGMFSGEEGWVLKPDGYHSTLGPSSTSVETPIKRHNLDLTIEVLAGQGVPLPADKEAFHLHKFHPYLKFQLHVDNKPISDDKSETARREEEDSSERFKRRSKTSSSAYPDYYGETFRWSNVTNVIEQLSFLRLKIQDDKKMATDDLAAWACIRLDRLRAGYRFIHLLDCKGMQSSGVLLVKITKCFS